MTTVIPPGPIRLARPGARLAVVLSVVAALLVPPTMSSAHEPAEEPEAAPTVGAAAPVCGSWNGPWPPAPNEVLLDGLPVNGDGSLQWDWAPLTLPLTPGTYPFRADSSADPVAQDCPDGTFSLLLGLGGIAVGADVALLLTDTTGGAPPPYVSYWGATPWASEVKVPLFSGFPWPRTGAGDISGTIEVSTQEDFVTRYSSCRNCTLSAVTIDGSDHGTPPISGAREAFPLDLTAATLDGVTLTGDFTGWDLTGTTIRNSTVRSAALAGATLSGATFDDVTFSDVDLRGAVLEGVTVTGGTFTEVDLAGTDVSGAAFDAVTTGGGGNDLTGLTVGRGSRCTSFSGMDLTTLPFGVASTRGYCGSDPVFPGSRVLVDAVPAAAWVDASLAGSTVVVPTGPSRAHLAGADLSGAHLTGTTFQGAPADLTETVLDGADLTRVGLEKATFAGASLRGVTAAGADFDGASFAAAGGAAAALSGATTDLREATFIGADLSGVTFASADLSGADLSEALAVDTDFTGVLGTGTVFNGTHVYGRSNAFDQARDLQDADFSDAVLAGPAAAAGGFDFSGANLRGARFDNAQCIGCTFTGADLTGADFFEAYLVGSTWASATLDEVDLLNAALYCGDTTNSRCTPVTGQPGQWEWPLVLGAEESAPPVQFGTTTFAGADLSEVQTCPGGEPGSSGCAGDDLLPQVGQAPAIPPACSAAGPGSCPTPFSTLAGDATSPHPTAVTAQQVLTWADQDGGRDGFLVATDQASVEVVGATGGVTPLAGSPGRACPDPTEACGDSGPAADALLTRPTGLAVGSDDAVYIADAGALRIRVVAPDGSIGTVVGTGQRCPTPTSRCGDGLAGPPVPLGAANDVWVDPRGVLYIADGTRGVRVVGAFPGRPALPYVYTALHTQGLDVVSVVGDDDGNIYAATRSPDQIIRFPAAEHWNAPVTVVAGTGTRGFNGNTDANTGLLLPATQVQLDQPQGLSIDRDGIVHFTDSGNDLVRGYTPGTGHVVEVAGLIEDDGTTQGGFNGDGRWSDQTELEAPADVATGAAGLLVVADTGNGRVRRFGEPPADEGD